MVKNLTRIVPNPCGIRVEKSKTIGRTKVFVARALKRLISEASRHRMFREVQGMKLALVFIVALTASFVASPQLAAQTRDLRGARTRLIPISFEDIELPSAPLAAREAKITVGGMFRTSCERDVQTRVDSPDAHTHYVRAVAVTLVDFACTQAFEREYVREVSLGTLDAGDHELLVEDAGGAFAVRHFTVAE
jgi:hypothetical protein